MNEMNDKLETTADVPSAPGSMVRTLRRLFMRDASVASSERLSPRFTRLGLAGKGLRGVNWEVGQKLQVAMGSGLTSRTYTPISWNAALGLTTILAYSHGAGLGSRWACDARKGTLCQLLGPRRSLDLSPFGRQMVFIGDETAFGLAAALNVASSRPRTTYLFEVSDKSESSDVLEAMGLSDVTLLERTADDAHLLLLTTAIAHHMQSSAEFILTGKAQSIQYVSQALKTGGVPPSRIKAKAYWAPGKTGLD